MPTYLLLSVDWRIVFKYLGTLFFPLGVALLLPLLLSLVLKDWVLFLSFTLSALIAFGLGWFFRWNVPEKEIKFRDGLIVAALSYPSSALIGAFPYWLGGGIPWIDSMFEAMSGFSTTGLTMVNPETLPTPLILWRSMTQWLGGIGFVVLALGFMISSGSPMVRLLTLETSGDRPQLTLEQMAAAFLKIYVSFTIFSIITLYIAGISFLDSVCFAFSALSTGGFAPYKDSASHFNSSIIHFLLMILMMMGAIQFTLYYHLFFSSRPFFERFKAVFKNPQFLCLLCFISIGLFIGLILTTEKISPSQLLFTVVAAQTTTGFSFDVPLVSNLPLTALLIPAMFIGGSLASTAGGIKLLRLLVALKVLKRIVLYPFLPKEEVIPPVYFGEHLSEEYIRKVLGLILAQCVIVFIFTMIFVGAGYEFLPSLFDVASAIGTVGLSAGIVTPNIAPLLKGIVILLMWMGRVEIFPVFMLYYAIVKKR